MTDQPFVDIHEELSWRGAIYDATPGATEILKSQKITCYNGFDPTSPTLHIGHLVPLMCMARMQRHGHTPIAILGAGTGLIGDPRENDERPLLTYDEIDSNAESIREQLQRFIDFDTKSNAAKLINNADWLRSTFLLDFLRDVGKHFTVNNMVKREAVHSRMEREDGISYTEFSYQLLQAFDYLVLFERESCTFQSGGSDQWGNILGGVDLIRRVHGTAPNGSLRAHGIVFPLITDSAGAKFGKSLGGAPALDANHFSPYQLYQFFFNKDDADVIRYLKIYTWLGPEEIEPLEEAVRERPGRREAQQALAEQVTRIVHGDSGLEQARRVTRAFFRGEFDKLSGNELADVFSGSSSTEVRKSDIEARTLSFEELAVSTTLARSLGDARRTVQQGGMYLNSERVEESARLVTPEDILHGNLLILRRGRREHRLIRVL